MLHNKRKEKSEKMNQIRTYLKPLYVGWAMPTLLLFFVPTNVLPQFQLAVWC